MVLHLPLSTGSSEQEAPSLQTLFFPNPGKDLVRLFEPQKLFAHKILHY